MRDTIEIFEPQNNLENAHIASRILAGELLFGMVKRTESVDKVINACLEMEYEMAVTGDWLVFGKTVKANQEIVLRTMSILSECLLTDCSAEDYLFPKSSVNAEPVVIKFSMFLDKVADGTKRHTIRVRKMANPGDLLELREFESINNEHRFLAQAICTHIDLIDLDPQLRHVKINGQQLTGEEIESLAAADGFDGSEDFWDFFMDELEGGFLIHWEPSNNA